MSLGLSRVKWNVFGKHLLPIVLATHANIVVIVYDT